MGRKPAPRDISEFKTPVWDQQYDLGETNDQYIMFLVYLNLPLAERTVAAAWRKYIEGSTKEGQKQNTNFLSVGRAFCWTERGAAWEIHTRKEKQQRWVEREEGLREADYQAGERLRGLVDKAAGKLERSEELVMDAGMVANYFRIASELQRAAIPKLDLASDQIQRVLNMLPINRQQNVIRILMAEVSPQEMPQLMDSRLTDNSDIIEAEVSYGS